MATTADIYWVRVDNATASRQEVRVALRQENILGPQRFADMLYLYFDTRANRHGPEFMYRVGNDSALFHMRSWSSRGEQVRPRSCGQAGGSTRHDQWRMNFSRACLGDPGRVRISAHLTRFYPRDSSDWAKARRTWSPWVGR